MGLTVRRPGTTPATPANQQRIIPVDGFWGRHQGTDYPIVPIAEFGWDAVAGLWIPKLVAPDGSFIEYSAAAILAAVQRLCVDMANGILSTDAVAAEIRKLTESGSVARAAGLMPARQATTEGHPVTDLATWQGMPITHDIAHIAFSANRKYVGIDAGAYTSPVATPAITDTTSSVTFTGVTLTGRAVLLFNATDRMYHTITAVVDPAGGAVGTLTVTPAIPSANAVLRIPYTDTPHGWNSAADAYQTMAVVGDPPRINGPATFISQTAATDNGTYQWVLPCALYGRFQLQIIWSTAVGTRTVQFRSYGKVDDAAWPVPAGGPPTVTTINQTLSIDDKWDYHTLAGALQFGSAAAGSGTIVARMLEQTGYNSIAIEAVVAGDDANNTTITAYLTLYGATK